METVLFRWARFALHNNNIIGREIFFSFCLLDNHVGLRVNLLGECLLAIFSLIQEAGGMLAPILVY
jgi:hypothetical protein